MPRIRTIKPELARHEDLYQLERTTGLPIRFAWALLPTICDREGRFKWRPRDLKLDILPYDEFDFSRVLDAWLTRGQLVKYRVGREWYGWLPTFRKHQSINNKEPPSSLPSIEDAEEVEDFRNQQHADATPTREQRDDDACATREQRVGGDASLEGKGREGEVREPHASATRGDEGQPPNPKLNGHPVDPVNVDHGVGGKAGRKPAKERPPELHASLPLDAWEEWLTRRRQKRWPCDNVTLTKQLNVLSRFDPETQRRIIDDSLNAGWQGIFEPKNKSAAAVTPVQRAKEFPS